MKFYIITRDKTIHEVEGKEFKEDSRLFVYKNEFGRYCLTDKATGMFLKCTNKLKEIPEAYKAILEAYKKVMASKKYTDLVNMFNSKVEEFKNDNNSK